MSDDGKPRRQPTKYAIGGVKLDEDGKLLDFIVIGVGAGTNVEEVIGIVASKPENRELSSGFKHFGGIPLRNLTVVPGEAGFGIITGDKLPVDDLFKQDDSEAEAALEALAARAATEAAEGEADPGNNGDAGEPAAATADLV